MKFDKSNFKNTANWKRIVSRILVLVMILTTAPITEVAYAAEAPIIDVVDSTEENLTETPDADSTSSNEVTPPESEEGEPEEGTQDEISTEMPEGDMTETPEEDVEENEDESISENFVEETEEEASLPNVNDGAANKNVMFRVIRKGADSAKLAGGSFSSGWNGKSMTKIGDGIFVTTESLAPNTYSGEQGYKIIFNGGTWYPDSGNQTFTVPSGNSITIDGNNVTITYQKQGAKEVYIAGGMNGWSSTATQLAGSNGTYTYTATLEPGVYPYKFVVDGNWIIDPNCANFEIETWDNQYNAVKDPPNVNSFFVISGLQGVTKTLLKGEEEELPTTLKYVDTNGAESDQNITSYAVKVAENENYVTIDGNKVTVDSRYRGDTLELIATAANGQTSTVTLELVDQTYTYTIYARSDVDSHMYTSAAELHIWDAAAETSVEPAEYAFTEKVTLEDGKEWLKAEVILPFSENVGIIYKSKGSWAWQTEDLFYMNKLKKDVTLYIVEGESEIFTSINDIPTESDKRYLIVDYTNASENYTNMNVFAWNTGYPDAEIPIQYANGKHIAKIPIKRSSTDMQVGFIVKRGYIAGDGNWDSCEKEGDDNYVTFAANQKYVKVRFQNGTITTVLVDNCGYEVDRKNKVINFYYRDDALFMEGNEVSLSGKVKLVVKSSTGKASLDGSHNMSYDATNERFVYTLPLEADTDYNYYYDVNGTPVLDTFNNKTNTINGVNYSLFRNIQYQINLIATVKNGQMDYNDNNLLTIDWEGKNGADIEGFTPEKIYANLSQLGMGSKVEINKELNTFAFSCKDDIAPGTKTITVTLIDDCETTFTTTANVKVVERTKTPNTDEKLGDFDWDEAVIYFAVTDRFFDGNTANNTATAGYDADDETDQSRYHGGDFAGLTAKMDYLYDLGVNTIWLTPIVDNVDLDVGSNVNGIEYYAYHGYWAEDFTKLNPHLGTEDEFQALLDAAHARGMKIMVDVVLNHAGYESTDIFNSILKDKEGNYINMIRGAEDTIPGDEKKDGLSGLPDFLTENEAVRNQLVKWQTDWMTKYDIDYYRVDTVKHVENTTWEAFKNSLTNSNPDFKMIGEYYDAAFGNTFGQLDSGRMDSVLDFGFKYYAENFVGGSISSVESQLTARNNGIDNTAMLGSFLSSHDEDGLLYKLNNKTDDPTWAAGQMKVAATLQITAKGQPVIYYGEEIGFSGANNYPYYDNRYDFDWDEVTRQAADADSFYNHYKKMLNIRRDYSEIFAKGTRTVIAGSDAEGYDVIRRSYNGSSVYVGMNVWGDDKEVTFPVTAKAGSVYTDLYSGNTYTVDQNCKVTLTIPNARDGGTVVLALTDGEEVQIVDNNTITVKFHYYRQDGQYETSKGDWNIWMWADTKSGAAYELVNEGDALNKDMVATMEVEGRKTNSIGFIVRKGDWKEQEGGNRFIDVSDVVSGTVHVYVTAGQEAFTRVLGADAILGCKIVSATYNRDMNNIVVVTSQPINGDPESAFVITRADGLDIEITNVVAEGNTYTLTIKQDLTSLQEVVKSYFITFDGYEYGLTMPNVYSSDEFENKFTYKGKDLGATWSKESTTFKLWAPTAENVQIALYEAGDPKYDDRIQTVDMIPGEKGVWSATVNGDLNGTYYTYLVSVDGKVNEACDPYATTTGVNGKRAMVIDLDSTDPEGWATDKGPHTGMNQTDAIIYELHVRDLSIDDSSGVSAANKGKYLGVIERGTKTSGGVPTGLDHMIDMGITHLHLLPVYDYGSVKEDQLDTPQFNWGYDPVNFNVPEGSYSTDPYNGEVRVKEFKQMVKGLHDNNINVIMDVVYNHVYDADSFCFNQVVPKYFSRTNPDGSYNADTGCGNTTASERTMVHKYIVDSILYWHNEYHIDGFRFDLVGLIDAETINAVVSSVHDIDPSIVFYGEGWNMSSGTTKGNIDMATQGNAYLTPGFAYFSDTFRDNLAGNNTNGEGFVLGYNGKDDIMKACFTASTSWCPSPIQTINYASCHDNYTLMDKLNVAAADATGVTEAQRIKMNNLSAAFYMLSEGVPFIHAGEEFLRTKVAEDGEIIHNSYNAPDYVNKLRWSNLEDEKYANVADYYKGLIEFRKNHKALRLTTADQVTKAVTSYTVADNVLLFKIAGDKVTGEVSDGIVVIFNGSRSSKSINLGNYGITGDWTVCINGENAGVTSLGTVNGTANVGAISTLVLVQGALVDTDTVYGDNFRETIVLDETDLRIKVGGNATLTATTNADTTITWTSDNEEVATVSEGVVTAVAAGTAVITATTATGVKATCTVTVTEHLYVISETELTLDLTKEETAKLEVTNVEVDSFTVDWSTDDEEVATVSETGLVTPVGIGSVTITAKVTDGPELTCQVTVKRSLESITISPDTLELGVGEKQTLRATLVPAEATAAVQWYTSDSSVVAVDKATGVVTAVATGTATITAKAEGKTATCEVTVIKKAPIGITAITNIHTKLSDVPLPKGWKWVNGAATVKSFVGVNTKNFLATYTEEGSEPITEEIPVNIITVSKVDVTAPAVLEKDKSADVNATIVTTGGEVPEEMVTVEWKSMKTDFMTVEQDADDELAADITGVKAGTTQVMATVTISDGVKSKAFASPRKSVKVVTEAPASISFNSIGEDVIEEDTEVYVYDFTEEAKVKVAIGSSASKVTLKSSDTGAVKVGSVKGENGIFTSELTIKKAGYVRLTATANDAMKSTTTFDLYIKNAVPNVDTNKIELNNKSTKTASIYVYPNEDYEIESVTIDNASFAVEKVGETAEYKVSLVGAVDKKSYKQNLSVKIAGVEAAYTTPFTINVVSKDPAVTVKQVGKLNTFYKDERAYGKLNVTSPELIANVELSECDFEYSYITGKITIKDGADRANLDKKGTLKVTFTEYPTVECSKNFTVTTEDKAPALTLSAKTATLYPVAGVETAEVTVNGDSISANDISVSFKTEEEAEAYEVSELGNKVTFTRTNASFTKKATVTITVNKEENYSRPVSLSYAISVNAKDPSLVLSKKALTLNKNTAVASYETDALTVSVKDAPNANITGLTIKPANEKAETEYGTSIILLPMEDTVAAELGKVSKLKNGTYQYKVFATIGDKTVKTTFNVKVVDTTPQKAVKLTAKGSIDVLNRDTTSIVYTPKFTNLTGNITDVKLTGRSSHLFKAELVDGKIVLTVKGNDKEAQDAVKLVTKYNYGVAMQLTLDNGCKFVTNEIKVKLKQSKPKVTVVPKQAVMFNTVNDNTVEVAITAANKDGTAVGIERIELTNLTNAFSYADGKLVLTDRGAVAKGKTYTLKFNVYFDGCADSEKPTTVTYKVKVN